MNADNEDLTEEEGEVDAGSDGFTEEDGEVDKDNDDFTDEAFDAVNDNDSETTDTDTNTVDKDNDDAEDSADEVNENNETDKDIDEEGEEAASSFSTGFAADENEENGDAYIPEKEELYFNTVLNRKTGIYYHHVAEDENLEDSSAITDWTRADEDTKLNPADIIRMYLSYTLPKDTINATNDIARYRLPDTLHLTDDQIDAINRCENGISGQYMNYDTLEITDPERHTAYLGLESVEGTRRPDQELKEDSQEYISATVKAEKIYNEETGEYEGTDLIFTFSPYTVEKNAHAYDKNGQPTRAGEEVSGWLTLDFNMSQIEWAEDKTSEIVFAEEDKENNISEISTELKLADPSESDTYDSTAEGATEEAAADVTSETAAIDVTAAIAATDVTAEIAATDATAESASTADTAETAAEDSTEAAAAETAATAATAETAAEKSTAKAAAKTEKDSEKDNNKKEEPTAADYPAAVFEDSITVRSGRLDTDLDDTDIPKKTKMTVHVEADEGTFPKGTRMVLSAVEDLDAVAEAVGTAVDAKTRGFQAVDITFYDKDPSEEGAKEIEPLKPIRVSIKSDEIRKAAEDSSTAPVVVHIEDDNTATEIENTASKTDSAAIEIEKPGVEADITDLEKNASTDTGTTARESDNEVEAGNDAAQSNITDEEFEASTPNINNDTGNTQIVEPQQENIGSGAETESAISEQDNTDDKSNSNHSIESPADLADMSDNHSDNSMESNEKDMPATSIVDSADASTESDETVAEDMSQSETGEEDTVSENMSQSETSEENTAVEDTSESKTGEEDTVSEDASESKTGEEDAGAGDTVSFEADSFSVYAVVYTVDFHYEVNGKVYEFSLPGGGYVSFEALMEVLGVAENDTQADSKDKNADNSEERNAEDTLEQGEQSEDEQKTNEQTAKVLTQSDIEISEKTKALVADVESVVFSTPELLWVGKVEAETTVGALKETNRLECQYSGELTEEQIEEINAQTVKAGDWALISVQPFNSEETLTITMENGDQFIVRVTDAQDPSVYVGKEVIIYDNGEQRAMTSTNNTWDGYRNRFPSIPLSEADGNDAAHWTIERNNNNYYLKSNNNKYLTIDGNNVGLVDNWSVATPLAIQAGSNPDYRIYDANNYNNVLTYYTNNNWGDGFFSAPGAANGSGEQQWLYIQEIETVPDRAGDWMLYFDDDFSEITVHVGETITLRPYDKWQWADGRTVSVNEGYNRYNNYLVQDQKYWNVGNWNSWTISQNYDNTITNGADTLEKSSDSDGIFEFTRYIKRDGELRTFYWSVQGIAKKTGDYVLTNTEGKTIIVRVVDGAPVNKPNTISNIANIKVNLFDYDNGGRLDVGLVNNEINHNLANDSNFKNESVNQMGGSDHFYFLSSGSGSHQTETWNNYTNRNPNPHIVKDTLVNGYPVLNHGNNTILQYLFDTSQASQSWHGGTGSNGMIAYPDVVGMFQKDSNGYYYYNSNTNYFYYDTVNKTAKLYEHTYTQTSGEEKGSLVNDKPIGFFPFHDYDATSNVTVNQNNNLNHHIGMSMEIEFMLPGDRLDDNGQPIIFEFSGDDDLWVFVEWEDENGDKQSKLLLDLGGVHQPIYGNINFTNGENTAFMETNRPYTLKVFYLERGGCDSNCSMSFNLPIIQDLVVAKKLTGLTEAEKNKYKNEEFWYEIVIDHKPYGHPVPYNYPNPANRYEKAVIRNAAGEDVTPDNFTIVNGRFKLKDGETLTITYLDRSDKFTVAELKTTNMENFEDPNAERYYHLPQDASLYEEEITLNASRTVSDPVIDDWVTPEYELEDTEKVTFTNTLKEKNLEVEKKWAGGQSYPDCITFKVSATVDDGTGGRTPYVVNELKESDGTTDKVFTLSDSNDWRHEIEHLPVNTPDGKFIFYDIIEGNVEGYVLTGSKDITAEEYNYCNIDVVKLWPDSNGNHTEVLQVVLKNSAEKYYAGVDNDGNAIFVDDISNAEVRLLNPGNYYSQRYDRLPYGDYTAVQLHEDEYNHGLAAFRRAIIQYELENTPLENPVNPTEEPNTPVIHKRIDALRDGVPNPDTDHADEDLTDLYRLYLDYKVNSLQNPDGVDLLFVIDNSGSMNDSHWPGNEYRAPAVMAALNGDNGVISRFLAANDKNQWAAVGFKGPDGFRDYEFSLKNPWLPKENDDLSNNNAGVNGSEVLSPGGTSYNFASTLADISLSSDGPLIQSNYTAGFWRAEQFLLKQDVKNDKRKKVVVFISDGVPTLHIDNLNGSLQNAGTAAGSPYYREEYGGCPDKALTEFGYFVNDMTSNGYSFGGNNGNIELYTIGLGAMMQTEGGADLLNGMLSAAYGQNVPANHYMTITDPGSSDYSAAAATLSKDLRIILGLNDTFSNLVIQDDLSKYVDLYGLEDAGSSASQIMIAAKARVTMTVPDSDAPSGNRIITLYENGAPADSEDAKFTKADNTKATIISELIYDASTKTVKAVFNSEYQVKEDVTYTLSFDVQATDEAYTTYAASGYDKYTSGENQGQIITGDDDTDFLGTTPANATSVDKAGFRSNDEAKATYIHNTEDEEKIYPHPVIQVGSTVDIVKIDQTGAALEGAKFNLYNDCYDASKNIEENAGCLLEADLQSKIPTDPVGEDAVIRSGKLGVGTYYLVETQTPNGYNSLPGPVKIIVTEESGVLNMTAEIAGVYVGADKLKKIGNGLWKLSVQNSAGYELPYTGGIGTNLFTFFGIMLTVLAGVGMLMRKNR
ncbi:MAG: SpaA isopeptide-forming pilin-related protein [Oscillospiraceae bacterium]|nr:SpaA isopeptide-forming pilin-related protein [Oscillospiraceae bacterium]